MRARFHYLEEKEKDVGGTGAGNLELVEEDQEHAQFLIDQCIIKGAARRFVCNIYEWAKKERGDISLEGGI